MAIQFHGSAYLRTPASWASLSGPELTATFLFRVDSYATAFQTAFQANSAWLVSSLGASSLVNYYGLIPGAGGGDFAHVDGFPVGIPVQVTLSYSATDPTRRFIEVNGHRTPGWAGMSGNINAGVSLTFGSDGSADMVSNITLQDVLFIDRALTDAEIDAYRADPAGEAASLTPTTTKLYYSFSGTVGADVATGDAGISIAGDATRSLMVIPAAGSTIKYVDPISVKRASIDQTYITTSGDALVVSCCKPDTDKPMAFTAAQVWAMTVPTISVNGGPSVSLGAVDSDACYTIPSQGAFFWRLPDGVGPLSASDVVTISAPIDWIDSALGGTDAMTARAVENRTGIPSAKPSDGLMRLGMNITQFDAAIWGWGYTAANYAKWMQYVGDRWEDGTMKAPFNFGQLPVVAWHSGRNFIDSYGYDPTLFYGLWAVVWEDYSSTVDFTSMILQAYSQTIGVSEVPAYATDTILPDGAARHVRVYNVTGPLVWNMTLAADVDAVTTDIPATAAPGVGWQGIPSDPFFIRLDIGGETIKVGNYDWGTHKFTGCTRGFGGTTAASHASGATFTAKSTDSTAGLSLATAHDSTHRYRNLRVYSPDNWTPPSSPGPVTFGDEDHTQLDAFFKTHLVDHGAGSIRIMETMSAMTDDISEIEDYTEADEAIWNYHSRNYKKWVWAGMQPFDPTGRYFYFNNESPLYETYSATLAADCDANATSLMITVPAEPGRIPYGQVLTIGSEKMRVVDNRNGTHKVVRGVLGTTAASHTSGDPITVGWRLAVTSSSQYAATTSLGRHYQYGEILLNEAASTRPLRCGIQMQGNYGQNYNDVNATARRSFKLASAAGVSDLTFTITPNGGAGDWAWIWPGGYFNIGSEQCYVTAVDSGAGTVTVQSRGTATAYAAGQAGTFTASGALFSTDDATTKYYINLYSDSPTLIMTGPDRALYRSAQIPAFGTNQMKVVDAQAFDPAIAIKPDPNNALITCTPWSFTPFDLHIRMCNEAKAHAWINFSYGSSDACVYDIVKKYRDGLNPGHKLYVALGNEVWNWSGNNLPITTWGNSWATGVGDNVYSHFLRSIGVFNVARACYAETGRSDLMATLEFQFGNMGPIYEGLVHLEGMGITIPRVDCIADAPYIVANSPDAMLAAWDASSDEQAIDLIAFDSEFGDSFCTEVANAKATADQLEAHFGWRPERSSYEAGDDRPLPVVPDTYVNASARRAANALRMLDLRSHPNYRHHQRSQWDVYRRKGGIEVCSLFCFSRPTQFAGDNTQQFLWGYSDYSRHVPGVGDGSDGKTDNRLHLFQQGKAHSVNPDLDSPSRYNVSVRMNAFNTYNDEFFAQPQPPVASSTAVSTSGVVVALTFDSPIATAGAPAAFTLTVDGSAATIAGVVLASPTVINLSVSGKIYAGQAVQLSGASGCVVGVNGQASAAFSIAAANGSKQNLPPGKNKSHPGRPWPFGGSNYRAQRGYR